MSDYGASEPSRFELMKEEMRRSGNWAAHPWWNACDPAFLSVSGLVQADVDLAFAELGLVFDPEWVLARLEREAKSTSSKDKKHWFIPAIGFPLRPNLERLVELGLALASVRGTQPEAARKLQRGLRDNPAEGAAFEVIVAAIFARLGHRVDCEPRGRGEKLLDLRVGSTPSLEIEAKIVGEDRHQQIAHAWLNALSNAASKPIADLCGPRRYVQIDLSPYMMSMLAAPPQQSKFVVASLDEHARGLVPQFLDALRGHDPEGYGRDDIDGSVCESWPRNEDGVQITLRGALIHSDALAERIYANALLDAVEKFNEGASGVVFLELDGSLTDLRYFAGLWRVATKTGVFRNVACVAITWRERVIGGRFDARVVTLFPNTLHPSCAAIRSALQAMLAGDLSATPGIALQDAPEPGRAVQGRTVAIGFSLEVPVGQTRNLVIHPGARPPDDLVERFRLRSSQT